MPQRTLGAEVVHSHGQTHLIRILWKDGGERGTSLRIVHPVSFIERLAFTKDRVSPGSLKRAGVAAYILAPVLVLLNTVVPQIPGVPYSVVLIVSAVLLLVAVAAGLWFFLGAGLVDRLHDNPLHAMKAPAVPAPRPWGERLDEVSPEAVSAYQKAYLACEVVKERIAAGESLQGQFLPSQESYKGIEIGLAYLAERKRSLSEVLAVDDLTGEHIQRLTEVAEKPDLPDGIVPGAVADEVREWVRNR